MDVSGNARQRRPEPVVPRVAFLDIGEVRPFPVVVVSVPLGFDKTVAKYIRSFLAFNRYSHTYFEHIKYTNTGRDNTIVPS